MVPVPASAATSPAWKKFWRHRVLGLLRRQFTQGTSPERLAWSIAVGTACSLLPFFGLTTLLNLAMGWLFRLNQPIMQGLNQLLGPLQVLLILVYVRLGEKIWHAPPVPISVPTLAREFRASPSAFLARFGWTGVHAATAWAISAPLIIALIHYSARLVLAKTLRKK